jgi:hypothetical protein
MTEAPPTPAAPSEPCARCGGDADFDIASLWLCMDCYHIAGSTCAGIGRVPATTHVGAPGESETIADQVC